MRRSGTFVIAMAWIGMHCYRGCAQAADTTSRRTDAAGRVPLTADNVANRSWRSLRRRQHELRAFGGALGPALHDGFLPCVEAYAFLAVGMPDDALGDSQVPRAVQSLVDHLRRAFAGRRDELPRR